MLIFRKVVSFFIDTVQTFVLAGAVFAIVYLFLFQPHQVVGDSMVTNFHNSEYVLTDKISYRIRAPERGEVIVFRAPNDREKDYIKRIIALPGESVKIQDGKVFINKEIFDESQYIASDVRTFAGRVIKESIEYEVPPNSYLVLGDNRLNSSDSREWGFVRKDDIVGKSFLVYWPLQSFRLVRLD